MKRWESLQRPESPVPFGVELLQLEYIAINRTPYIHKSPVPFGVELLQLSLPSGYSCPGASECHQCLSAWSFFSCLRHADDLYALRIGSPVPFGVELLQLPEMKNLYSESAASVTSAFRRGASSAVASGAISPIGQPCHQCLSAWSFFSWGCERPGLLLVGMWVTSAFRRGASSAA